MLSSIKNELDSVSTSRGENSPLSKLNDPRDAVHHHSGNPILRPSTHYCNINPFGIRNGARFPLLYLRSIFLVFARKMQNFDEFELCFPVITVVYLLAGLELKHCSLLYIREQVMDR